MRIEYFFLIGLTGEKKLDQPRKKTKDFMKWIKVLDQLPPLQEKLLLCYSTKENSFFRWFEAKVFRPYDSSKKFNPDYYEFEKDNKFYELVMDMYWLDVEDPDDTNNLGGF